MAVKCAAVLLLYISLANSIQMGQGNTRLRTAVALQIQMLQTFVHLLDSCGPSTPRVIHYEPDYPCDVGWLNCYKLKKWKRINKTPCCRRYKFLPYMRGGSCICIKKLS
ncbi:unnamed protein product [Lymnaea stagnalis]|uniref:Uncharacterized protein n=1 Tax=Lymnaea stagnalis TaxID=6523 RepID=A0AAV2IDI6_LYMST